MASPDAVTIFGEATGGEKQSTLNSKLCQFFAAVFSGNRPPPPHSKIPCQRLLWLESGLIFC